MIESSCSFFPRLVVLFMVALFIKKNFKTEKFIRQKKLQIFGYYFICIARVKLIQSLRLFQTMLSNSFFLKWLCSIGSTKLHMKIVVGKLQSLILFVTRKDVRSSYCFASNVKPLRSTVLQSLMLYSFGNIFTK